MRKFINIIENAIQPKPEGNSLTGKPSFKPVDRSITLQRSLTNMPDIDPDFSRSMLADLEKINQEIVPSDLENMGLYDPSTNNPTDINNPTSSHVGYGMDTTSDNLPTIVSNHLVGELDFNPDWHQVKHLPGMMMRAIQAVAGKIFRNFTSTPIGDIQMMTTAARMNPDVDVMKMASLIVKNGVKVDEMTFDFSDFMPGYQQIAGESQATLWKAFGYDFMIMKDNGGHYIYGWPEGDSQISNWNNNTPLLNKD